MNHFRHWTRALACAATLAILTSSSFAQDPAPVLKCKTSSKSKARRVHKAKKSVRTSAQRGLNFLTDATLTWQKKRNCMGCHVQGVAAEALTVGRHHQYKVEDKKLHSVFSGLLDMSGGVRTDIGHAAKGSSLRASTRAFAGASLARYDRYINDKYGDDLLKAAGDLLEHQSKKGDIAQAYNHGIAKGPLQGTYQAIQTWKQAYERTADDRWLTAVARSEAYLQRTIDAWHATPTADLQHINYALLGLLSAGVGSTEKVAMGLRATLLESQNKDGGFPMLVDGASRPLSTGMTLYTLRRMGLNDEDKPIQRAVAYLVKTQQKDGGWSDTGGEKAEAMWAVLGLVSTDVLSLNVAGLRNGQHVAGTIPVSVRARDNEGGKVNKVEILVDDVVMGGACKDSATYRLDASKLSRGLHTIDVRATNHRGKLSTRRLLVYAGDHYLTNTGTKFSNGGTLISLRDIAPTKMKHTVELQVMHKGKPVYTSKRAGAQGPMVFHWKGELSKSKKKRAKSGEYDARLVVRDAGGKARHTRTLPFVHDTEKAQAANYSQVQGQLQFAGDDANVQNATVELVDEEGNVVQSTRSTSSGKYRFRNVKSKRKYKVRVRKNGKKTQEAPLKAPAASKESKLDFKL